MISSANTIVNPGAMMVKSFNALVADGAVPTIGTHNDFAHGAEIVGVESLQEAYEFNFITFLYLARIASFSKNKSYNDGCSKEEVKYLLEQHELETRENAEEKEEVAGEDEC